MRRLLMVLILLAAATTTPASEPLEYINYQGVLRDAWDAPLDGRYSMVFRFYDAYTGGTLLLQDSHITAQYRIQVTGGLFNTSLGSGLISPDHVYDSMAEMFANENEVYLEVKVGTEILSPRTFIRSSAYALNAGRLGGRPVSAFLDTSSTTQVKTGTLRAESSSGFALEGAGPTGGGFFDDTNGSGYARVAFGNLGIEAWGSQAGGTFNKVGIGTQNPTELLTVTGTIESTSGGFKFPDGSLQTGAALRQVCAEISGSGDCDLAEAIHGLVSQNSVRLVDGTGDVGKWSSIAVGRDGKPVISYQRRRGFSSELGLAMCTDSSCSGATVRTLDEFAWGTHSSIAIGADGYPVVSYRGGPEGDQLKVVHCNDTACGSYTIRTPDTAESAILHTSIAVGANDTPVISYGFSNAPISGLKVAHCNDPACSSSTVSQLDTLISSEVWSSIAVGEDGRPVISYHDAGTNNLKIALCIDTACSGATFKVVDTGGDEGNYGTSIVIGSDGNPVIAYADAVQGSLEVLHCVDPVCSGAEGYTVDDAPGVQGIGWHPSIAIDADGIPVISYYDDGNEDLRIAHCDNLACSSATIRTLDSVGKVGSYSSLAIGTDSRPVVSYYDDTNGNLKVITHVVGPGEGTRGVTAQALPVDRRSSPGSPLAIEPAESSGKIDPGEKGQSRADTPGAPMDTTGNVYARSFRPSATDLASLVSVVEPAEAGDVLVIDPELPGRMSLARRSADTGVFGIVASEPGVVLGARPPQDNTESTVREVEVAERVLPGEEDEHRPETRVAVAVAGVALCKVDAGFGTIRPGDLLTTSPTAGHAMLAVEPRPGTILGKALEPLEYGTGLIKVLVMLR